MKDFLKNWKNEIQKLSSDWHYLLMCMMGIILIFASFKLTRYLSAVNDSLSPGTPVGDILFSVLPKYDLSFLFIFGAIFIMATGIFYGIFFEPKKIPLGLLAFSLFLSIRALCISLTHIAIPPDHIPPLVAGLGEYFFQNDLFFSGHTGAPFLGALLLWDKKPWRYFFFISSIIMAITVLVMRLHYSIDIVGAYFITYGIYHIAVVIHDAEKHQYQWLKKWFL